MAFSFTSETSVLYFGPRSHAWWTKQKFVLWPAWAYRVVAPRVRQRRLNVLQRAVLGLGRAGVSAMESVAKSLDIHVDLAEFIMAELTELGHLDLHACPTKLGLQALDDDAMETQEMVTGYVFQDPWSGDLWPRFVEQLEYCELEYNDRGYPGLMLGSTGRPKRRSAFMVFPKPGVGPATPSARSVVEAVSAHRKGLQFSRANEDNEAPSDFVASGVQINRVSFVEEKPQPVFLTTFLYVPKSDTRTVDWYACDPFGLGQSVRLRRSVERHMRDSPLLHDVVRRLVGEANQRGHEEHRLWFESLELEARLEVERRLTLDVQSNDAFGEVFGELLAMQLAMGEVNSLGDACPDRKVNEVLRAGAKVLEACFSVLFSTHQPGDAWERVFVQRTNRNTGRSSLFPLENRDLLAEIYRSALRDIGFVAPPPQSFLSIRAGVVKSIAKGRRWGLRPLLTTAALGACQDTSHPLRRIAAEHPSFLEELEEVADQGGAAGHANAPSRSVAEAARHVDMVYRLVMLFLDLGRSETLSSLQDAGVPHG